MLAIKKYCLITISFIFLSACGSDGKDDENDTAENKNGFTLDMIKGKTFYNTYADEDQNDKWVISSIEFVNEDQAIFKQDSSVTSGTYSLISGIIKLVDGDDINFVKNQNFNASLDAYETCWIDSINDRTVCTGLGIEYLFSDEQKAINYINLQNNASEGTFSINMVGKTAKGIVTNPDCPSNQALGKWDYTFTTTDATLTGFDAPDSSTSCFAIKPSGSYNFKISEFSEDEDFFFNCKDYPICKKDDFEKVIRGIDGDNRSFTTTYTFDESKLQITASKTVDGATHTEVITIQ